MQIIHKVNNFFFKLFHYVTPESTDIKIVAVRTYYSQQSFVPKVTWQDNYIISSKYEKQFSGNQGLVFCNASWTLAMPQQVQYLGLDFGKEFKISKETLN